MGKKFEILRRSRSEHRADISDMKEIKMIKTEEQDMEYVTLNNGVRMPVLGYGVYQVSNEECERCVLDAIGEGYRSIDTAQAYGNDVICCEV